MRASWRMLCALLVSAQPCGGCTQLVQVDDYTFDEAPCGERPITCPAGGTDLTFVIVVSDVLRLDEMGRRDGFDLDGTSDAICGQRDFVSTTGDEGIDNQLAGVLELYESLKGLDLPAQNRATYTSGESVTVVFVEGYEGPDDDCVQVTYREARVPEGVAISALDVDRDGELDPGLTWDYGSPLLRDATACTIDGVIHAQFPEAVVTFLGVADEVTAERMRMRMPIAADRIVDGRLGGSLRLDDLAVVLPPELVEFLRPRADIAPSRRDARDCSSISFGLSFDAVPAERGAPL